MNKIIIFHLTFTDLFNWIKKKYFEKFEFSTTFSDICINADDVKIIKSKTSIIFKSFKLGIAAFVTESMKDFADVIIQMRFEKTVSFRVAASERKSVGSPSISHRQIQFSPIVPIRRIGTEPLIENPIRSDNPTDYVHA